MKIAVCFFGHLRTFKRCAPYIKLNLLHRYNCDLFMHTWSDYNHQTKTWHDNRPMKGIVSRQEIINTYGTFKGIVIEKQIVEDLGDIMIAIDKKQISLFGLKSMYHSMQCSYNLCAQYSMKNNVDYDFVVMIRPDIALSDKFDIVYYTAILNEDELKKAFLTITNNLTPVNSGFKYLRAVDLMFFGKPSIISDILNNTPNIIRNLSDNRVISCSPEFKFIESVKNLGYIPYEIKYLSWTLVRPLRKRDWVKQIISIRIRKNYVKIHLIKYLMFRIFSIRINLFNFEVECCVGKSHSEC